MPNEIIQLGGLGIIFAFAVKEFFSYLKSKKDPAAQSQGLELIFKELQTMNNNHLHSIQDAIEKGNERLIDSLHNDNMKMIELLGEIKGNLSNK